MGGRGRASFRMAMTPGAWGRRTSADLARRMHLDNAFDQSVVRVASGTLAAQAITVAVSPVLTRLFTPTDFGIYAAAVTIFSLVLVGASLRYQAAIPLPPDEDTAASLILLSALLGLVTTVLMAVCLWVFGPWIAHALGAPGLIPLFWVVVLSELGASLYQVVSAWAIRAQAYGPIAQTRIAQGVGMAAGQVVFGLLGAAPSGLLYGDAIGRTAGIWGLAHRMWHASGSAIRTTTWSRLRQSAIRYRRFPAYSLPASLLDAISNQAPLILLLVLYGPAVGGYFLLAQRVGSLPVRLIGASVAQVFFGEASRLVQEDRAALPALFTRTVRRMAVVGAVPTILLAVVGPTLFPFVFGENWEVAGIYLALLAPTFYFLFIWGSVSGAVDVAERQNLLLIGELVGLGLVTGAVGLGRLAGVDSTGAVVLLAIASSWTSVIYVGISWLAITRPVASHAIEHAGGSR